MTDYVVDMSTGKRRKLNAEEQAHIEKCRAEDAALLETLRNAHYQIPKTLPWLRMTSQEADLVLAAIQKQPPKFRAIYDAAQYLFSGDDLWGYLNECLASVVGEERAKELLATDTYPTEESIAVDPEPANEEDPSVDPEPPTEE